MTSALSGGDATTHPTWRAAAGAPVATPPGSVVAVQAGAIGPWRQPLQHLLARYQGRLALQMPDGSSDHFGAGRSPVPSFTLCLRTADVLRRLLLGRDPLRFAEAYFRGDLDIEGDLFAALSLRDQLQDLQLPWPEKIRLAARLLLRRSDGAPEPSGDSAPRHGGAEASHTRQASRADIAFHYDLSNAFYQVWLDPLMVYSCAYFETPELDLEQAQSAKLDHICRKLMLAPGERLLDIGCGWGALILHAARHYGVQAHGITLSQRQYELARERIWATRLTRQVSVALQDYRDLPAQPQYDKVASVGMFEHVGLSQLPDYFDAVHRVLRPRGYFLNHGITHDQEGWGGAVSSRFINRYVFPGGELDTVGNIQRVMERCRFEILDVEGLRLHYAKTLRHWVQRLEQGHSKALESVNEASYRVWRLYMAASALEFESGSLGLYQILSRRRAPGVSGLPMTRHFMYPPAADAAAASGGSAKAHTSSRGE